MAQHLTGAEWDLDKEEADRAHGLKNCMFPLKGFFSYTGRKEAKKFNSSTSEGCEVNSCHDTAAGILKRQCGMQTCWVSTQLGRANRGRKAWDPEGK